MFDMKVQGSTEKVTGKVKKRSRRGGVGFRRNKETKEAEEAQEAATGRGTVGMVRGGSLLETSWPPFPSPPHTHTPPHSGSRQLKAVVVCATSSHCSHEPKWRSPWLLLRRRIHLRQVRLLRLRLRQAIWVGCKATTRSATIASTVPKGAWQAKQPRHTVKVSPGGPPSRGPDGYLAGATKVASSALGCLAAVLARVARHRQALLRRRPHVSLPGCLRR